jgi:hypothetical protein
MERKVLETLRDCGPVLWNGLYVAFDPHRTGEIGMVLDGLRQYGHISKDQSDMTSITEKGLVFLGDAEYWD